MQNLLKRRFTRAPFPNSRKVYVKGEIHDIEVAMREVALSPTKKGPRDEDIIEENPPVTIYDTSGPYTDDSVEIDVRKGLPRLRQQWIEDRGDVEELASITSMYGQERLANERLDHLRFDYLKKPLRAKPMKNVSQMYYAKRGIITPEMEYVAIRGKSKNRSAMG